MKFIPFILLFISLQIKAQIQTSPLRDKLIRYADKYIGIREKTGHNDGVEVEAILRNVGLGKGNAWCAALQAKIFDDAGLKNPHSAYCPDWFKTNVVYRLDRPTPIPFMAKKGQNAGFFIQSKGRIGHIGMIYGATKWDYWLKEGNTNEAGSDEGEGAYNKIRNKKSIYIISDHLIPYEK